MSAEPADVASTPDAPSIRYWRAAPGAAPAGMMQLSALPANWEVATANRARGAQRLLQQPPDADEAERLGADGDDHPRRVEVGELRPGREHRAQGGGEEVEDDERDDEQHDAAHHLAPPGPFDLRFCALHGH